MPDITVIIPAFNEEKAIGKVIREIPKDLVTEIIVVNNNSDDNTKKIALSEGATVLDEPKRGYGQACLKGIAYLKEKSPRTDIVVFMDGDYSDYPDELRKLIKPIIENDMDMVIGSRTLGKAEKGALTPQQGLKHLPLFIRLRRGSGAGIQGKFWKARSRLYRRRFFE